LDVKLSQIVIRLKIIRLQGERLTKLLFRRVCLPGMKKARCQICSCCGRIRFQLNSNLQLFYGLLVF